MRNYGLLQRLQAPPTWKPSAAVEVTFVVATGWAMWLAYQYVCSPLLNGLFFPWTYTLPSIFGWGTPHGIAWWIIWIAVRAFSGWVVARLSREHATAAVIIFAGSVLLWKIRVLPWTFHLLAGTGDPRYLREVVAELMGIIVPFASILLGGLWGARSVPSSQPADVSLQPGRS
jgi:hypothetical protein